LFFVIGKRDKAVAIVSLQCIHSRNPNISIGVLRDIVNKIGSEAIHYIEVPERVLPCLLSTGNNKNEKQ
jgi:hypothetical protein